MLENIQCLGHSAIKMINNGKTIYIDPYKLKKAYLDADIIFVTHNHYDHYSEEDIKKIKKEKTKIVIPEEIYEKVLELGFLDSNILTVKPNNQYQIEDINVWTIPSYNTNKKFHPKENNWVGYIIERNSLKYYIAGDTDITEENKRVICDVAFLPVGGIYTMTYEEAALLASEIEPKIVVPIHYGVLVGSKEDAIRCNQLLKETIQCEIMYE